MSVDKQIPRVLVITAAAAVLSLTGAWPLTSIAPLFAAEPEGYAGRPPAGQMCPRGSFVIGFDAGSNIVCSPACGNGVVDAGESCDDGNTEAGDGCSPGCRPEAAAASSGERPAAEPASQPESARQPKAVPQAEPAIARAAPELAIDDVEPSSVVFGTSEVTLTLIGTGFTPDARVVFEGSTYEPAVDPTGTRLTVTLPTRRLTIGPYAITVTDASGGKTTLKRALVVF